jgi:enediyne biosynthesis protein E5
MNRSRAALATRAFYRIAATGYSMTRDSIFRHRCAWLTARFHWLLQSDARHYQIAALACLLTFNIGFVDFGAKPLPSAFAIISALATQIACARVFALPNLDLRSPLITGLSLSLLLRADALWIHAVAGVIAIASKFLLRIEGKHIWNPAGFAIVVLLLTTRGVWISPGQWGTGLWLVSALVFAAILVLRAARRTDIALFFLGSHAALLFARAVWLGDPLAIPMHQLQSGSLLIFSFFMISDPRTAPDSRTGRFLFAFAVAASAHWLAFFMQIRPALYFMLIAASPLVFVIDKALPAQRFIWTNRALEGASQ